MQNLFDRSALAGLASSPAAFWQSGWQMMNTWQQAWMNMYMPGSSCAKAADTGLPDWAGIWLSPAAFMAALMPYLPRIEANIIPLKREGALAGAEDAARIAMRIVMPGFAGQGSSEVLLVDAVVARAAGENAMNVGRSDLPPALPKKTSG